MEQYSIDIQADFVLELCLQNMIAFCYNCVGTP